MVAISQLQYWLIQLIRGKLGLNENTALMIRYRGASVGGGRELTSNLSDPAALKGLLPPKLI